MTHQEEKKATRRHGAFFRRCEERVRGDEENGTRVEERRGCEKGQTSGRGLQSGVSSVQKTRENQRLHQLGGG